MPLPHDPGPHWGEVGIHGLHRHREWDAVATVDAPDLVGEDVWFVVLGPGEVVAEDGEIDARLVSSIALAAPFRAHAVRRDAGIWVVGPPSPWSKDPEELRCLASLVASLLAVAI